MAALRPIIGLIKGVWQHRGSVNMGNSSKDTRPNMNYWGFKWRINLEVPYKMQPPRLHTAEKFYQEQKDENDQPMKGLSHQEMWRKLMQQTSPICWTGIAATQSGTQ